MKLFIRVHTSVKLPLKLGISIYIVYFYVMTYPFPKFSTGLPYLWSEGALEHKEPYALVKSGF